MVAKVEVEELEYPAEKKHELEHRLQFLSSLMLLWLN